MERSIPHVLDIFTHSPGQRRRARQEFDQFSRQLKEQQKNPGSDSAVSLEGSSEEEENERKISNYFNYLNAEDTENTPQNHKTTPNTLQTQLSEEKQQHSRGIGSNNDHRQSYGRDNVNGGGKTNALGEKHTNREKGGGTKAVNNNKDITSTDDHMKHMNRDKGKGSGSKVMNNNKAEINSTDDPRSRKGEYEIRHIERHLSMKKTIRKKMMRDLQQAFVENPGEFTDDLDLNIERVPPERRTNIDLNNLTISKKRISKSEHSFLDMLKEDKKKDSKPIQKGCQGSKVPRAQQKEPDEDSGNDSPTRKGGNRVMEKENLKSKSKQDLLDDEKCSKEDKKPSFWKRLTGKSKTKR